MGRSRDARMPPIPFVLLLFLLGCNFLIGVSAEKLKMCQIGSIDGCGTNEMCVQTKSGRPDGVCQCLPGFGRINKECVGEHPTPPTTPGTLPTASPHTNGPKKHDAVVTGILVPLLLVLSLVGVLGYLGRRYNWPGRARTLAQRMMAPRRTNDVLIRGPDDDDDPIA